jgi:hypothetical protein
LTRKLVGVSGSSCAAHSKMSKRAFESAGGLGAAGSGLELHQSAQGERPCHVAGKRIPLGERSTRYGLRICVPGTRIVGCVVRSKSIESVGAAVAESGCELTPEQYENAQKAYVRDQRIWL